MDNNKIEKAIIQARANLLIDKIEVSDTFIDNFKKKKNIEVPKGPKLILSRGGKIGPNK
jgi:hypothetical protein